MKKLNNMNNFTEEQMAGEIYMWDEMQQLKKTSDLLNKLKI